MITQPIIDECLEKLKQRPAAPPLEPTEAWNDEISEKIAELDDEQPQGPIREIQCGLYLWNDDLEQAGEISPYLASREGEYWNAILERREGNYSESQYWYRTVHQHKIYPVLRQIALRLATEAGSELDWHREEVTSERNWAPQEFVEWCREGAKDPDSDLAEFCRQVQLREIELLIEHILKKL